MSMFLIKDNDVIIEKRYVQGGIRKAREVEVDIDINVFTRLRIPVDIVYDDYGNIDWLSIIDNTEPKTEIESLQEKIAIQDAAVMELAQILSEVMDNG